MGQGKTVVLVLLDLSAAFDTIDTDILCDRLNTNFGVGGSALGWIRSYLNDRTMSVNIDECESSKKDVKFGVPQGSILGPTLYSLYTSPIETILEKFGLSFHMYADDTQIYIPISDDNNSIDTLEKCIDEIKNWMTSNKLKLNEDKTEILKLQSKRSSFILQHDSLNVAGNKVSIPTHENIRNLGSYFDSHLSMETCVSNICKSCHFHLNNIRKIRNLLDVDATHVLVHAFVTSRLDYSNSLLCNIPKYLITRLQKVQNQAAKLVLNQNKYSSSTTALKDLHWLPIEKRIEFKIATITYKCLNELAPPYLSELLEQYVPSRNLRSSTKNLLICPRTKTVFENRAFSIAAPNIWNNLSTRTRNSESLNSFKKNLKTEYFRLCYD